MSESESEVQLEHKDDVKEPKKDKQPNRFANQSTVHAHRKVGEGGQIIVESMSPLTSRPSGTYRKLVDILSKSANAKLKQHRNVTRRRIDGMSIRTTRALDEIVIYVEKRVWKLSKGK